MISIGDVSVNFGSTVLLDRINFHISDNDRIGLVGKNGAGKSTLMKLICGEMQPSSGHIDKPSDVTIGYLPQIMAHHKGRSVLEETMTAFDGLSLIEKEIAAVNAELAERDDYESEGYLGLITRLSELNDRLSVISSRPPEVRARRALLGLGFKDEELGRKTETFSQGWNMRIELAKILLSEPDVLMLDEPTNHLDIESICWLEDYLKNRKGALILVSHDRHVLDTVTNRTVEIMLGHIHDYKVPYTKYLELRAERLQQQTAAYENQQKMIEKTEDFIRTFRYKPTKSNQVQSRIKALEKLERVEIDETDNVSLTVKFQPAPRSGEVVYKGSGLTVGYPQKVVFSGADLEIRKGEKVAFVGRNGEGKTTMMRVITGELQPISGESTLGFNVSTGYFAQNQEDMLDGKDTVWETLDRIAVGDIRGRLRELLAQFLFRGEDIDKRVSVLSGGERARLGMAKLMLKNHNLLALDEPTNHMDIKSKDILKQALQAYDGTLVVVSHDRDFLDGLVTKLYEFRDGKVREFIGSVSEFLDARKLDTLHELEKVDVAAASKQTRAETPLAVPEPSASSAAESRNASRERSRNERKVKQRIAWLEGEIARLEEKMGEIEKVLSAPKEGDDIMELTRDYLEAKRDLDAWTQEWESLYVKLEN